MSNTVAKMLRDVAPDRLMIEASGLAHAASVIDAIENTAFGSIAGNRRGVYRGDPRQFVTPDYAQQALYKDQIGVCDVLVASKTDCAAPKCWLNSAKKPQAVCRPKRMVAEVDNAQMNIEWLDIPVVENLRYRLKTLPDNTMGFQSQGFTFAAGQDFDGERLA